MKENINLVEGFVNEVGEYLIELIGRGSPISYKLLWVAIKESTFIVEGYTPNVHNHTNSRTMSILQHLVMSNYYGDRPTDNLGLGDLRLKLNEIVLTKTFEDVLNVVLLSEEPKEFKWVTNKTDDILRKYKEFCYPHVAKVSTPKHEEFFNIIKKNIYTRVRMLPEGMSDEEAFCFVVSGLEVSKLFATAYIKLKDSKKTLYRDIIGI